MFKAWDFFIVCFCDRSCCHVLRLSETFWGVLRLSGYIYMATLFQRLSEALRGSHVVIYGVLSGSQALRLSGTQYGSVSSWYHDFMFWGSQRRFNRFRLYHCSCIASYGLRGSQRLSGTLRGILCCSALPGNAFGKRFHFFYTMQSTFCFGILCKESANWQHFNSNRCSIPNSTAECHSILLWSGDRQHPTAACHHVIRRCPIKWHESPI